MGPTIKGRTRGMSIHPHRGSENRQHGGKYMTGLLALCDREGVRFEYDNLDLKNRILGIYFRDQEDKPGIILHDVLQHRSALARTVMAEEVAHHITFVAGTLFDVERTYDRR